MASVRKQQRNLLIALIGACLVMAAGIAYIQSNETEQAVKGIDKSTINRIAITQTKGQEIMLELQNGQWQITEPSKQAANGNRVEPLLTIAEIKPSYPIEEVDTLAAGLDTPIASITFNGKRFDIGELDVSGERRYAKSNGQVYFFPEWVAPLINGGVSALAAEPTN